jgi:hypothetical protein
MRLPALYSRFGKCIVNNPLIILMELVLSFSLIVKEKAERRNKKKGYSIMSILLTLKGIV